MRNNTNVIEYESHISSREVALADELVRKDQGWMVGMTIYSREAISMRLEGGALVLAIAATLPEDKLAGKPFFAPSGPSALTVRRLRTPICRNTGATTNRRGSCGRCARSSVE